MKSSTLHHIKAEAAYLLSKCKHHEYTKFRHISFIVQYDEIIAYGWNHKCDDSPPLYPRGTIHAEYHAFKRAKRLRRNKEWECVNIRFNMQYELRLAAPCRACEKFLRAVGCSCVVYSENDGFTHLTLE